jgi:hypothetical protein
MEEIKGDVLADMMQDTWELYPGTWPIPNDPDVELVCAPLQKVSSTQLQAALAAADRKGWVTHIPQIPCFHNPPAV